MSENRCRHCNRPLSDPEAAYGWRCTQIMGYNPDKLITQYGKEIGLLEHVVHQAMDLFEEKGIEYRTPHFYQAK